MNGNNQEGRGDSYIAEIRREVPLAAQMRVGMSTGITALRALAGPDATGNLDVRLAAARELVGLPCRYALVIGEAAPLILDYVPKRDYSPQEIAEARVKALAAAIAKAVAAPNTHERLTEIHDGLFALSAPDGAQDYRNNVLDFVIAVRDRLAGVGADASYDAVRDRILADNPPPRSDAALKSARALFDKGNPPLEPVYPALLDVAREHLANAGEGSLCIMLDNGRFEVIAGTPQEVTALLPTLVRDRIGGPGMLTLLQQAAFAHAEVSGGSFLLPTADGMAVLAFGPAEWVHQATGPTPLDPRRDNGSMAPAHPEVLVEAELAVTTRAEAFPGENALMKAAITAAEYLVSTDPRTAAIAIEGLGDGARFAVVVGSLPALATYMAKAPLDLLDSDSRINLFHAVARSVATEPFGGYVYDLGDSRLLALGSEQGVCNALIRRMATTKGGADILLRAAATLFLGAHDGKRVASVTLPNNEAGEARYVYAGTRDNCIAALARDIPADDMRPAVSRIAEHDVYTQPIPTPYRMRSAKPGTAEFSARWWLWLNLNDDTRALMVPSLSYEGTGLLPMVVTLHGLATMFEQSAL